MWNISSKRVWWINFDYFLLIDLVNFKVGPSNLVCFLLKSIVNFHFKEPLHGFSIQNGELVLEARHVCFVNTLTH